MYNLYYYLYALMGGDKTIYILFLAMIIAFISQMLIKSRFKKYSRIGNQRNMTGGQAARAILDKNGLHNVRIEVVPGALTDHYDPRSRTVRLSQSVYSQPSIASLSVAAHEVGHAIQHARHYIPLTVRSLIAPIASFSSNLVWPLIFLGLIFSMTNLFQLGIYLFLIILAFQLVTLPVEFNASRRAMNELVAYNYLSQEESRGAKKVLSAAALTYVAATLTSVAQLTRLILLSRNRD